MAIEHLLGRATHVDVDDASAQIDVDACCFSELRRIAANQLYDARFGLTFMIHAAPRLVSHPQALIGAEHFGWCEGRAKAPAQLPKRSIGHAGHRRQHGPTAQPVVRDAQSHDAPEAVGGSSL